MIYFILALLLLSCKSVEEKTYTLPDFYVNMIGYKALNEISSKTEVITNSSVSMFFSEESKLFNEIYKPTSFKVYLVKTNITAVLLPGNTCLLGKTILENCKKESELTAVYILLRTRNLRKKYNFRTNEKIIEKDISYELIEKIISNAYNPDEDIRNSFSETMIYLNIEGYNPLSLYSILNRLAQKNINLNSLIGGQPYENWRDSLFSEANEIIKQSTGKKYKEIPTNRLKAFNFMISNEEDKNDE